MSSEETPHAVEGLQNEAPLEGNSVVDLLRQDLAEIRNKQEIFVAVPGYAKSNLQIKYRLPESGELTTIGKKIERQYKDVFERNLYTATDTMIALCEGLYVQPEGHDEPQMLDLDTPGEACRFDYTLAAYLGMDTNGDKPTAREIVKRLFDRREFAIINHAEKINRWLVDANADVSKEFWQTGE